MKVIAISVFCLLSASLSAQVKPKSEIKKIRADRNEVQATTPTTNTNKGVYYSEYVIYPEKLKTYFVSETIPTEFPHYDKLKSFEENKEIARVWAKANKELVKPQFWHLFEK
jgi:hypothetical protein